MPKLKIHLHSRTTRKGGIVSRKRSRQVVFSSTTSHDMPAGRKPNGAYEWDTISGCWLNNDGTKFIAPPTTKPPQNVVGWDARKGEWIYALPKRRKTKHRAPSRIILPPAPIVAGAVENNISNSKKKTKTIKIKTKTQTKTTKSTTTIKTEPTSSSTISSFTPFSYSTSFNNNNNPNNPFNPNNQIKIKTTENIALLTFVPMSPPIPYNNTSSNIHITVPKMLLYIPRQPRAKSSMPTSQRAIKIPTPPIISSR